MASGRDVKAGGAWVSLGLDKTAFVKGLKAAEGQLKAFGASIRNIGAGVAAAGTAVGGAMLGFVKHFANVGDELLNMSQRTGFSVEALSELRFAAGQAGATLEDIEAGAKGMEKLLSGVGEGGRNAADTLSDLGLTLADLQGLSPEKQFEKLGDAVAAVPDPAKRAALAMEVFGKSGTKLLPLLTEGVRKGREMAKALGVTFTTNDAKRANAFNTALGSLLQVVEAVTIHIGSALADEVKGFIEKVTEGAVKIINFVKANKEMIVAVAKIAGVVALAGTAIIALGVGIQGVGFAMGGFAKVITTVGGAISGIVTTAFKVLAGVLGSLLTPIGLLGAGLAVVAGLFVVKSGLMERSLGTLGDAFREIKGTASETFDGIMAALAKNDLSAAMQILWAGMKVAAEQGLIALSGVWTDLKTTALDTLTEMWGTIQGAWARGTAAIAEIWTGVIGGLQNAWDGFVDLVLEGIEKIAAFEKRIGDAMASALKTVGASATGRALERGGSQMLKDVQGVRKDYQQRAGDRINERDQQAADTQKAIEDQKNATLAKIRADADAAAAKRALENAEAAGKSAQELDRLRQQLHDLIQKTKEEPPVGSTYGDFRSQAAAGAMAVAGGSTAGTFSGFGGALMGLSGGGVSSMVAEQRKTTEEVKGMRRDIRNNQPRVAP